MHNIMLKRKINSLLETETIFAIMYSAILIEEFVRSMLGAVGMTCGMFVSAINYLLYFASFVLLLIRLCLKKNLSVSLDMISCLLFYAIFLTVFLITEVFSGDRTQGFRTGMYSFFPAAFLYSLCGKMTLNLRKLVRCLSVSVFLAFGYGLITLYSCELSVVYLTLAYNLLPWAMIAHMQYVMENKKVYLLMSIMLALMILLTGARMPLLCLLCYMFLAYIWKKRANIQMIVLFIALLILGSLTVVFLGPMMGSRSVLMILQGKFFASGERMKIYNYLLSVIVKHPFDVRGLFADRVVLGDRFYNTNDLGFWVFDRNALYAHNLLFEVLIDFGLLIGGGLLTILFIRLILGFSMAWKNTSCIYRCFFSMLFCIGFLPLLVSSSFLINLNFWLFLSFISNRALIYANEP